LLLSQIQSRLISSYKRIRQIIDDLGNFKRLVVVLIVLHLLVGAIVSPILTTDLKRNLFYGNAFWEHGFKVYDMKPLDIDPNYDIIDPISGLLSYPNTTYDYPTIQLLFWAGMSLFPFSNIMAKWTLSLFDFINFFLMFFYLKRRGIKDQENETTLSTHEKVFIFSYLLFSIPFSAMEGQSTSVTIFFLIVPIFLHKDHPILSYLCIGLGFHWKYVSFLVLPYLVLQDVKYWKKIVKGLFALTSSLVLLSFPLLVSGFILHYFSFFGRLNEYSGQTPSNPLLFSQLYISSILTTIIIFLGLLSWFGLNIPEHKFHLDLRSLIEKNYWTPFLLLLLFLKIYSTAFPWYWMWFYPLIIIFHKEERRLLIKLLGISLPFAIIDFIDITVGLSSLFEVLSNLSS